MHKFWLITFFNLIFISLHSIVYNEKSKQQLLYYTCVIMGQSVVKAMKGQNKMRRDALGYFVKACRLVQVVS